MDHFIDVTVLPDPEFKEGTLMNALFAKLHRALCDTGRGEIGISFPRLGKTPGDCLRLHGSGPALGRLMATDWLKGMRDYTRTDAPKPVPATAVHGVVRRVQVKSNVERLRRRSVKNGRLTEAEALEKIPQSREVRSDLPFLILKSNSSQQTFRLLIQQGARPQAVAGRFNEYGLSTGATVPLF